jgi:cystathionine beta-synthase
MIHSRISQMIGHTPTLELPLRIAGWRLLLKLEKFNPGQSMKDRMALRMLEDARVSGRLRAGGTVIESSSGNTGTALALLCAERGYRFIAVVDHHAAKNKVCTMKAYGAEIVYVEGDGGEDEVATKQREARARELADTIEGAIYLEQAHNPANAAGYEDSLSIEIANSTGGRLDLLVGAVGTGGSLSGTARGLRRLVPRLRVIGVEPEGSIIFGGVAAPYFQSGTGTPSGVEIGRNVDYAAIEEGRKVTDARAFNAARFLARHNAILVGGAAGGVVYTALSAMAERPPGGVAVVIVADGGEKYLDTVFDDAWMEARGLLDPSVDAELRSWVLPPTAAT